MFNVLFKNSCMCQKLFILMSFEDPIFFFFFSKILCYLFQIVEFIAVLLRTSNDAAENELVSSGTIRQVIDLFFE